MLYDMSVAKKVSLMEEKIQRNPEPVFPKAYQKSMASATAAYVTNTASGSQSSVRSHLIDMGTSHVPSAGAVSLARPKVARHTPSQRASSIAVRANPLASPPRKSDV